MCWKPRLSFRKRSLLSQASAAAALGLMLCDGAAAQSFTWTDINGNWSLGSNWVGGSAPTSGVLTALTFGGVGAIGYTSTNDMPAPPFVLNQTVLNSAITGIGSLAPGISGNLVRFDGVNPTIIQAGSGDFYFRGPVDLAQPITFAGNGIGNVTFDGKLTGAVGITKTGASAFRFGSAAIGIPSDNTFFGGLTITDGTVRFNNSSDSGRTALRGNRVNLISPTAVLSCISQIRCGELNGVGTVIGQDTPGDGDGKDITILGMGNGSFGGTVSVRPTGLSTASGKLATRGIATQTLTGAVLINDDLSIGRASGLTLAGNASVASATAGQVLMHGGTLTLDNSSVNNNNRLRDAGTLATGIESVGGGTFNLIGNVSGTMETIGRLELGSPIAARAGGLTVKLIQPNAAAAPTVLNIASYLRDSTKTPRTTVDFAAADEIGAPRLLGVGGNNPQINFVGASPFLQNGLLSRSESGANDDVGWATVNGSDFATNGANGIAAVATVPFAAVSSAADNALLAGDGIISSVSPLAMNSLKILPSASGQSLAITDSGGLSTNAIVLAGNQDFDIVNGGIGSGGISGPGGSRYFQVPSAALTVGVSLGTSAPLTKAGEGFLVLTNPANSASQQPLTINSGIVRATPGSSLPGGLVELRGGVLELSAGTYSPLLGSSPGNLNWRADDTTGGFFPGLSSTSKGSGGFSAFGAPVVVDLNGGGPTNFNWEDPYFVDGAHALVFGSIRSNASLTMIDNFNLTGTGTAKYNLREFRVTDNPNSASDFTRISGAISGTVRNDLLKSGDGILELTGINTLFGGMVVGEGALLFNNASALGPSTAAYILLGLHSGSASSALLASNSAGTITLTRDVSIQVGSSGNAVLGNMRAPDAAAAGDVVFSGNVTLGITASNDNRLLQLTSEPGSTVTFGGAIAPVPGYNGAISLEKIGAGTVVISGSVGHTGATVGGDGTLVLGSSLTSSSSMAVGPGAVVQFTSGGGKVLRTADVSVNSSGQLDLSDNAAVVDYAGPSPMSSIAALLTSGYASGAWNGNGILSSSAAANPGHALGYAEASAIFASFPATFAGQSVDNTSVLVRYTRYGDADLNGIVGLSDFNRLAGSFGQSNKVWSEGDFNYDGVVSLGDFNLLAANFGLAASPDGPTPGQWAILASVVPEPSTGLILAVAALPLSYSLKRNRHCPRRRRG